MYAVDVKAYTVKLFAVKARQFSFLLERDLVKMKFLA